MKKHKFWRILLGIVVAVVVLGAIGFGFYRHWAWGGRYAAFGRMPHDYRQIPNQDDRDMPCEDEDKATCLEHMPFGGFRGRGMPMMPYTGHMPGMYGSWGGRGSSLLTNLLLLVLIVIGVLLLVRWNNDRKFYHHGPVHMPPIRHPAKDARYSGEEMGQAEVATDDSGNPPDNA